MAKLYVKFTSIGGPPVEASKCTTRWPDSIACSIPISGQVESDHINLMIMTGDELDILDWIAENEGKVEQLTKEEAEALGQLLVVPGTERIERDMTTGITTTYRAGNFDVNNPDALWAIVMEEV